MNNEIRKESTVLINDKEFKVVSVFSGNKTASELIYDMTVKRILNENSYEIA